MPAAAIVRPARRWSATIRSDRAAPSSSPLGATPRGSATTSSRRASSSVCQTDDWPLRNERDALESHSGVDVALLQLGEGAVLRPVERHEDVVPDLDVLGDVGERRRVAVADPHEDLGVRTARPGRPVRPPVVVRAERVDAPSRIDAGVSEHLLPDRRRVRVGGGVLTAAEHRHVQEVSGRPRSPPSAGRTTGGSTSP